MVFPINIWINEERYEKLQKAGLSDIAEEVFAGLKRLQVPANEEQKDAILKRYPRQNMIQQLQDPLSYSPGRLRIEYLTWWLKREV